jgi:predicted PurR-regulated permease PerM
LAFLFVLICTITLFVGITYFVSKSLTDEINKIPAYKNLLVKKYADLENQLGKWGFAIGEWENRILPGQKEPPDNATSDEPITDEPVPPDKPMESMLPSHVPPPIVLDLDDMESSESEIEAGDEEDILSDDILTLPPEEQAEWIRKATSIVEPPSLIALDPQSVALWITRIMLYVRGMLEGGFIVLILMIFMLFEASFLPEKVNRAFGKDGPINIEHFHRIAEDIRRYLFLKTLANLMSGGAAMFVYYRFGVPAAFLWGVIAFFMYYIPNIGGTLAAVIPGILILMLHGVPGVLLYAVCLVTLECTIAYGIEPKMLGHGLRLSTLVIILSLFFWGFLLGPIGLFLAAPLTVMIKIMLQAFPETRWIAVFLDAGGEKR